MNRSSSTALIGIAFLTFVAVGFTAGLLGVAWPSIRYTFGVSLDAIGALLLASTVAALLISLNSGPIISKIGLGRLLALGCIIGGLGYLGAALAPTWWALVAASFVIGIGTSGVVAGLNTYFAISQSTKLMTWLQACFGLGATLSPVLVVRLLDAGGSWRWGYAVVFLSLAVLSVGFGYTRKQWHLGASKPSGGEHDQPAKVRSTDTLRLLAVWLSLLLFFTFTGLEGSAGQWPYTLFTEGRGISPRTAGLWVSVFWFSTTVGRIVFGVVVSRVGVVPLIRGAMGGVILGTGLIWWNLSDTASFLGLALVGFAASPIFPVLTSDTPERLGPPHAANAIGFQLASARLGLAAIPALAGVLAAALGLEIIGPFLFAFAVTQFLVHEITLTHRTQAAKPPSLQ